MIKAIARYFLIFIACLVLAYLAFVFLEGGFRMKDPGSPPWSGGGNQLLFAHRGVVGEYPENSLEAIREAGEKGFRAIETDIRRSADGEFILFHDGSTERLLGFSGMIAEMDLEQIRKHRLMKGRDTTTCRVATLREMLAENRNDFIFYFDMKLGCFRDVDDLVHFIMTEDIHESVILASPSFLVSLYIEYHYPLIYTAMEGFDAGKEWVYYLIPKNLKPDFLSGFSSKVNEKQMDWLQSRGLASTRIVYGVDSTDYQEMVDLGIKNMIIDYFSTLQPDGI